MVGCRRWEVEAVVASCEYPCKHGSAELTFRGTVLLTDICICVDMPPVDF